MKPLKNANQGMMDEIRRSIVDRFQFQEKNSFKSEKELWLDEVRRSIVDRGHPELLPLMNKLDRTYNETEEELFEIIRSFRSFFDHLGHFK